MTNDFSRIDLVVDNKKLTTEGRKVELRINGVSVYNDDTLSKFLKFKRARHEDFEALNVLFAIRVMTAMFGHPERYKIVTSLAETPKTFTEIQKTLRLKPATLDFHMKKLQSEMIIHKSEKNRKYELTIIGRAVLDHFLSFLKKIEPPKNNC